MISPLETTVCQWRKLGLLQNCRSGGGNTGDTLGTTLKNTPTENNNKKRRKKTDKDRDYNNRSRKKLQKTTLLLE
jgi:hypothetical protein